MPPSPLHPINRGRSTVFTNLSTIAWLLFIGVLIVFHVLRMIIQNSAFI